MCHVCVICAERLCYAENPLEWFPWHEVEADYLEWFYSWFHDKPRNTFHICFSCEQKYELGYDAYEWKRYLFSRSNGPVPRNYDKRCILLP